VRIVAIDIRTEPNIKKTEIRNQKNSFFIQHLVYCPSTTSSSSPNPSPTINNLHNVPNIIPNTFEDKIGMI
jgi:hypothetical protein